MIKKLNKKQIVDEIKRFVLTIAVLFFFYISFELMGFTNDESKDFLFLYTFTILSLLIISALRLFIEENQSKTKEYNLAYTYLSFLFLLNIYWDKLDFISYEFEKVLPIFNVMTIIVVILGVLKVFIWRDLFSLFVTILNNILIVIFAVLIWIVFPFNLGSNDLLNSAFRLLIIFIPLASTLYTILSSVKYVKDNKTTINK